MTRSDLILSLENASAPDSSCRVTTTKAIGLLGGTFDPIHRAHLHLARAALIQLRLSEVHWLPTGQPWHRRAPLAAPEHRLAMVRLATADEARFYVNDTEIRLASAGYTVETLERLRGELGNDRPLVWLMGADAFLGLSSWHRWREILDLCHLAVAHRPGSPLDVAAMVPELATLWRKRWHGSQPGEHGVSLAQQPAGQIVSFTIEPVEPADLSATMVRGLLAAGEDAQLARLLPNGVLNYIRHHRLYAA